MVNYAYLNLGRASAREAAERAGRRLAAEFPGCRARIVDEGRLRDGTEWLSVRFDASADASASKCLHAFSAELHDDGLAFWRVVPERKPALKATTKAAREWRVVSASA